MRGQGQATKRRKSRARGAESRLDARLAAFLAAMALLSQLLATPLHRMAASTDVGRIASEFKAVFGDAAALCVQADGDERPGAPDPQRHCDVHCPLCQAGAGALALLVPPSAPALTRLDPRPEALRPPPDVAPAKPNRTVFAQPRAPPVEA